MNKLLLQIVVLVFLLIGSGGAGGGMVWALNVSSEERNFDKTRLEEYKNDKDFQYENDVYRSNTLWNKVRYYFYKLLKFLFGKEGAGPVIRYMFLVAIVLFVVLQLSGTKLKWFLGKENKNRLGIVSIPDEDISGIDLAELAEKALSEGALRLCVRYHYLQLLKILDEKAYITWHRDKTNRDYLAEITQPEIRRQFQQQTLVFDYVWYGDFQLTEEQFQWVNSGFQNLMSRLQTKDDE
ncbi:DUF4129 domain-containing protein [Maribellus sp. CM-23]|uniref:DUF4129 domain-containing protein n=1 Tax=Maribellus sp. CM-23 TaxID=2781026 RepID=UPI001F2FC520|nr:DUF4129 domain-containing protein [Maribellus sp. CM-23]MCE4563006.1 DUF4129 domain-containing protein [Maribellus sp. CM-23]